MDQTLTAVEPKPGPEPAERGEADRPASGTDRALERLRAIAARRWFWPAALLLGYLFQVAFRASLVVHRAYPSVHADEDSYLVLARVLAGHSSTEMPVGVVIPGGYPLLLAPAIRFANNSITAYHLIMGINAVLNALVFVLLFAALRRAGLGRPLAYLFGTAAALMPPVVFYSQFVMTETIFPVLLLGWLLCMHGWLSPGTTRARYLYGIGMAATAAYSMATHDRGGVICAITGVVLLAVLVLGWAPRLTAVVSAVVMGAGMGAAKLLASYLESKFDTTPPSQVGNLVFEALFDPEKLPRTLTRVAGELWYFMMSTWGIGAIALAFCLVALFTSRVERPTRLVAFSLLASVVGIALASAAGLGDDPRVDNWVYARYLSSLVPVVTVIGVALLVRAGRRTLLLLTAGGLLLMGALGETVVWYVGRDLKGYVIPWGVPDAMLLGFNWTTLHLVRATEVAVVIAVLFVLFRVAGGRQVIWVLGLGLTALAFLATTVITAEVAKPHYDTRKFAATGFIKDAGIKRTDNLVMDWDNDWGMRMAQPYEVYWGRVWTTDLKGGTTPPAQATVALLRLPTVDPKAPDAPRDPRDPKDPHAVNPADSWKLAPAGWYVDKVSWKDGWVLWRHR
ncbi:hypothetical protein GCM10010441_09020 [Kitasatospora paracochleata]|uniref:Dolichyl-phosphate-mannose-protein mannosyltransferase n=1 Tax=Kitasatospora paracochleata TaxID=58354 RepID=A0ABT1IXC0_9ACTN|nr:hypothetical protein [Kitasatospora paracochleata]MCP2309801.1 hypothetical protein [Kitasatospora paracochleata]